MITKTPYPVYTGVPLHKGDDLRSKNKTEIFKKNSRKMMVRKIKSVMDFRVKDREIHIFALKGEGKTVATRLRRDTIPQDNIPGLVAKIDGQELPKDKGVYARLDLKTGSINTEIWEISNWDLFKDNLRLS